MNTKHYFVISGIIGGVMGSLLTTLLVSPVTAKRDKFQMKLSTRTLFRNTIVTLFLFVALALHANHPRLDTIRERIANRDFPSVFGAWHIPANRAEIGLTDDQARAHLDLHITNNIWPFHWYHTNDGLFQAGSLAEAQRRARNRQHLNPHQVTILSIYMRDGFHTIGTEFSRIGVSFDYWIRDANGRPVPGWPGTFLLDFTHPEMQDRIVQQAVEAAETGLFDGIFFDWWQEDRSMLKNYRTVAQERAARENILTRIREAVHPDFLIIVNMNDRTNTRYPHLINGSLMETLNNTFELQHYKFETLLRIEKSLRWLDENMREPIYNNLLGSNSRSKYDTPTAKRMMRFFTTMSLTHSNSSVLYAYHPAYEFDWHSFWDANLGKPISPKSQQVEGQGRLGCFIREFDNGWAVYNRSRKTQVITLPDVTLAASTGKFDYIHEVPSMDGEIFLRSHPTGVSPRSKLATTWGALKRNQ